MSAEAISRDGRTFQFDSSELAVSPGDFVELTADGVTAVGQVDALDAGPNGTPTATGKIYAAVGDDGTSTQTAPPFSGAGVAVARPERVEALLGVPAAVLEVGTTTSSPTVPARVIASKFNRHTFWCGQSGSGKTYALGVLLEELLMHTTLPMVIFDPNADFVRLAEVRDDATPACAELLRGKEIRVLRSAAQPGENLRARFTAMQLRTKAAMLRLDPLVDRTEFNTLLHSQGAFHLQQPEEVKSSLLGSDDPGRRMLGMRVENLGILEWEIWARQEVAATEIIDTRPAATVLDLGGFQTAEEPLAVAISVLDELWERREERRPVLLVIDEAHNLCSPQAETPLQKALLERIIQIAAEGRKYGLWLLLSTQRPSKVHSGIISQCDNLTLMRMSSRGDLEELATIFGFAPAAMMARAPHFGQGESLLAGGFVTAPVIARMRQRSTHEGGRDVAVPI